MVGATLAFLGMTAGSTLWHDVDTWETLNPHVTSSLTHGSNAYSSLIKLLYDFMPCTHMGNTHSLSLPLSRTRQQCLELHNFNSAMTLMSALGSASVARLKKTWAVSSFCRNTPPPRVCVLARANDHFCAYLIDKR